MRVSLQQLSILTAELSVLKVTITRTYLEKKKEKKGSTALKRFQCNFRYDAIHKNTRQQGEKSDDERFNNKITQLLRFVMWTT